MAYKVPHEVDMNVGLFGKNRAFACLSKAKHVSAVDIGRYAGRQSPVYHVRTISVDPAKTAALPTPFSYTPHYDLVNKTTPVSVYYKGMSGRDLDKTRKPTFNEYRPKYTLVSKRAKMIDFASCTGRSENKLYWIEPKLMFDTITQDTSQVDFPPGVHDDNLSSSGLVDFRKYTGRDQVYFFGGSVPLIPLPTRGAGDYRGSSVGGKGGARNKLPFIQTSPTTSDGAGMGATEEGQALGTSTNKGAPTAENPVEGLTKMLDHIDLEKRSEKTGGDSTTKKSQRGKKPASPSAAFVWEPPQVVAKREKERRRKLPGSDFSVKPGRNLPPHFVPPPFKPYDLTYNVKFDATEAHTMANAVKWGRPGTSATMKRHNVEKLKDIIVSSVQDFPRRRSLLTKEESEKSSHRRAYTERTPDIYLTSGRDEQYAYNIKTLLDSCGTFDRPSRRPHLRCDAATAEGAPEGSSSGGGGGTSSATAVAVTTGGGGTSRGGGGGAGTNNTTKKPVSSSTMANNESKAVGSSKAAAKPQGRDDPSAQAKGHSSRRDLMSSIKSKSNSPLPAIKK